MRLGALLRTVAATLVALSCLAVASEPAGASAPILGGGSGFAALVIDQWRADTARSPYNLSINYVSQGSTFGRQQFTLGTFDYATSDIQYEQLELPGLQSGRCKGKTLAKCFVYVPVTSGGLAFMYNLTDKAGNRISDLRLTRKAACEIFTGAITTWNAPDIVATNPRLASISSPIHPVFRSDGAGESFVLSEFCIAVEPAIWNAFVASQKANSIAAGSDSPEFLSGRPTSEWPAQGWGNHPVPQSPADGTASYVADPVGGANSITYVAAGYAKQRNFPMASVENAAGVFTQPDEPNVTVALGYASPLGNGTFKLNFTGPDPRAYFPSTYSYVLAQTTGFNPSKGATLGQFLCYAISAGQPEAPPLKYARLSSALVNIAENAIVQIPGAPSRSNCFVAGAPPPPPPPAVLGITPGFTTPGSTLAGLQSANILAQNAAALRSLAANNPSARAAAAALAAQAKKARDAQAAIQRAANAAAAAQQQGANLDTKLAKDASGYHPSHSSHTPVIYLLLGGAVLAWGATIFMGRRRSMP